MGVQSTIPILFSVGEVGQSEHHALAFGLLWAHSTLPGAMARKEGISLRIVVPEKNVWTYFIKFTKQNNILMEWIKNSGIL